LDPGLTDGDRPSRDNYRSTVDSLATDSPIIKESMVWQDAVRASKTDNAIMWPSVLISRRHAPSLLGRWQCVFAFVGRLRRLMDEAWRVTVVQ